MADFNKLKDTIRGAIYPNGRGAISADKHQAALLEMADTMQETDSKVTELSAETIQLFPQANPVDGALSIENRDDNALLMHQFDKVTNKDDAIHNFNRHNILRPSEAIYSYPVQQQRFISSIVKVSLKGSWKLSPTDEYYVSYFVNLSGTKKQIDISANINGNKLRLGTFEVEWSTNDTIIMSPFIPNVSDGRTKNIEGYGIFDASMFANLPNRYNFTYAQGSIDIEDRTEMQINSIFTPRLREKYTEYLHDLYVAHFKCISFNVIPQSPIYLTSLNKIMSDGALSGIRMTFSQFSESGGYKEIALVESDDVTEGGISLLTIKEKNDSGVNGHIVIDFSNSYFLGNHNTNALSDALPYEVIQYSIGGGTLKERKSVQGAAQYGSAIISNLQVIQNNLPILNKGMRVINKESNTHHILCVTSDGVAYCKDGKYGNWLQKTTDFVTFENVQRFDIFISYVKEMGNGELLVFTGNNRTNPDLSAVGVFKSSNNRTTWKKVITPSTQYSTFASWSIDVFGNKVIVGEYGDYSVDTTTRGSRYLYYSEDAGNTFKTILDVASINLFEGFDQGGCHIHGACYDPYWDRIWVVTGDANMSKSLAWTDDKGETWKGISLYQYTGGGMSNQTLQFISVYAMRNNIILAPDCPYQHMFRVQKFSKNDIPVIEKAWAFRNINGITHLTTGYKRFGANEPVLVMMGRGDSAIPSDENNRHNFILATFDGQEFHKVWEDVGFTKYPQKGVDIFKVNGKYLIDIDNYEVNNEGVEEEVHNWLWLTDAEWH